MQVSVCHDEVGPGLFDQGEEVGHGRELVAVYHAPRRFGVGDDTQKALDLAPEAVGLVLAQIGDNQNRPDRDGRVFEHGFGGGPEDAFELVDLPDRGPFGSSLHGLRKMHAPGQRREGGCGLRRAESPEPVPT
jgi:hypothetical protein